jgi:hypothetical protein
MMKRTKEKKKKERQQRDTVKKRGRLT